MLVLGESLNAVNEAKREIGAIFQLKDLGEAKGILGIEVYRNRQDRTISLRQSGLISQYRANRFDAPPILTSTPMITNAQPKVNAGTATASEIKNYQKMIGELMYISRCTRPDTSAAVSILSRFASNPSEQHRDMIERVYSYIASTSSEGLIIGGTRPIVLEAYCDADWAGDVVNRKSTSGFIIMLVNGSVAWGSSKQKCVPISTMEAEYVAAGECIKEAMWLTGLIRYLGEDDGLTSYCDNEAAIATIKNPTDHSRAKHIDINYHFIRNLYETGKFKLEYVKTNNNIADIFTKALNKNQHHNLRRKIGMAQLNLG